MAFTLFGQPIYWYGIIIACAFLLAIGYILKRARTFGVDPDRALDVVIGGVIGIASIVFAMAVVVFSGVSVKLTGTALELSGGIGDRASIPYTEITGVEWRDVFDKGSRTWGTGTGKISSGTFTNDEFGAYRLYLHNRVRCAVVVRHGADETTVFNGETEEKTKEVYEELASRAKT